MILLSLAACQNDLSASTPQSLPTRFVLPALTATPRALMAVNVPTTPTADLPTRILVIPSITPTPDAILSPMATLTPTLTPRALPESFAFGYSVQGRELTARRFGTGTALVMLVGGIHGGWESNTVDLMNQLIAHYERTPSDVLDGITLVIVPALNPDGVALGRTVEGRFNANRVDLNRNWGCGWESVAYFRSEQVSAGDAPFSEAESSALAALILEIRPATVLFYHSAANGIYEGDCGGDFGGAQMARVLGEATGYSYGADFSAYPVTGTAPSWVNAQGIPSADVELATWETTEFERNLRGVTAIQCWLVGSAAQQVPACAKP